MAEIKRKTEATDKKEFYRTKEFAIKIMWAGVIFQLFSGLTEGWGLFKFGSDYFGNHWLYQSLLFLIVFVLVFAWEAMIRATSIYFFDTSIKAFKGQVSLKLENWIMLVFSLVIGFFLVYYSVVVSKKNTHLTFRANAPDIQLVEDQAVIDQSNEEKDNIQAKYKSDKKDIESRYTDLIIAQQEKADAEKAIYDEKINKYNKLERSTGKKYSGRKDYYKNKKLTVDNNLNTAIAELNSQKAGEVKSLQDLQISQIKDIEGRKSEQLDLIADINKNKAQDSIEWNKMFSWIVSMLAGYSVVLALLCILFIVILENRVGINVEYELISKDDDIMLLPAILALLDYNTTGKLRRKLRKKLYQIEAKKKSAPEPTIQTVSESATGHRERVNLYEANISNTKADNIADNNNTNTHNSDSDGKIDGKIGGSDDSVQKKGFKTTLEADKKTAAKRVDTMADTIPTIKTIKKKLTKTRLEKEKVEKALIREKRQKEEIQNTHKATINSLQKAHEKEKADLLAQIEAIQNTKKPTIVTDTKIVVIESEADGTVPCVEHTLKNGEKVQYTLSQVQGRKSTYKRRMDKALKDQKLKVFENNKANYELFQSYENQLKEKTMVA